MRSIYSIVILIPCFISCKNCGDDISFTSIQKGFTSIYNKGDTLIFSNDLNEADTLIIVDIVNDNYCATWGMGAPYKSYSVKISHGTKKWDRSKDGPEHLLVLENGDYSESAYIGIKFRGFYVNLLDGQYEITSPITQFQDIKKYWRAKTQNNRNRNLEDNEAVIEIIWTEKHGLTRYRTADNQWFTLQLKN